MKRLIATLTFGVSLAANAEFYSGNDLLSKLNDSSVVDRMVGMGYVIGVFDVTRGIIHCPPENITAGQVRDMVHQYLRASPSDRHLSADQHVVQVLKQNWPCAKRGQNL